MAKEEPDDDAGLIVIEKFCVADAPVESVTIAEKLSVAAAVGVPLMTPVDELSVSPDGSEPVIDQVYGGCPPVAERVAEYATLTVPDGRLEVVIANPEPEVFVPLWLTV